MLTAKLAGNRGQPLYRSIAAGARGLFAELDGELALAERHSDEFLRYAERAGSLDAKSAWAGQVFGRDVSGMCQISRHPHAPAVISTPGGLDHQRGRHFRALTRVNHF